MQICSKMRQIYRGVVAVHDKNTQRRRAENDSSEWLEVSGRNLAYSDFARKANAKRGKGKIIE